LEFTKVNLIGFCNTVDTNQVYLIFKGPKIIFEAQSAALRAQFLGAKLSCA
jgi:hypothetical protein